MICELWASIIVNKIFSISHRTLRECATNCFDQNYHHLVKMSYNQIFQLSEPVQVSLQSGQARHWAGQGRISYDLTMWCTWTVFTLELPLIWWSELEASYDLRKCTWTVLTLELSMIWQSVKYSFDIGQFWLLSFTPGGDVGGPLPNGHATPQTAG